jgi:hypothetical protein
MSRRRRNDDSSLELLLDTITNTFGGILFLAILVSLLLQSASPTPEAATASTNTPLSAAEQATYEVALEDLQDQLSRLQQKRRTAENKPATTDTRADDEAAALAAEIAEACEERARAGLETAAHQRARSATLEELSRLDERRSASTRRLEDAKRERADAAAEAESLIQLRDKLERSSQASSIEQTAGMPTIHQTHKQQVAIYVRFGRLFLMHSWRNGSRMGPNPAYFVVTPGSPPVARPKPGAGIPIQANTIDAELGKMLKDFPPAGWVVAIVVFGDSFEEFQIVKRSIVEKSYEYNPIPVKPGGSVFDSGGDSRAQ